MNNIRITKEFKIEMAHALYGYDGKCKNIHGHSYYLHVTVIGPIITDKSSPKNGMVLDFSDLKKIVNDKIISQLDHALLLNENSPDTNLFKGNNFEKVVFVDYQPTCENLLADFAKRLKSELPVNLKLHSLKLSETVTSYAEWYAEDNQ